MSVLDVSPGLKGGHLRYPTIIAKKDWFADVVAERHVGPAEVAQTNPAFARALCDLLTSISLFCTQSGKNDWSTDGNGYYKTNYATRHHYLKMKCCVFWVKLVWIEHL